MLQLRSFYTASICYVLDMQLLSIMYVGDAPNQFVWGEGCTWLLTVPHIDRGGGGCMMIRTRDACCRSTALGFSNARIG